LVPVPDETGDALATDEVESLDAEIDTDPETAVETEVSLEDVEIVGKPH
jgi:hypothetical protein